MKITCTRRKRNIRSSHRASGRRIVAFDTLESKRNYTVKAAVDNTVSDDDVNKLVLYITNDGELYKQVQQIVSKLYLLCLSLIMNMFNHLMELLHMIQICSLI